MNQVTEQFRPTVDEPDRPTPEEIERRAYKIYDEGGRANGNDVEDWLRAERELLEESQKGKWMAKAKTV